MIRFAFLLVSRICLASPQKADSGLEFEAASVKPTEQARESRVTRIEADPVQLTVINVPLATIIIRAYHITGYEFSGPSWTTSERYDIVAKIPEGATPEQQSVMLQNLLAQRFGLKIHREPREKSGYALTVARGGQKFKAASTDGPPANSPPDPEGYPVLPPEGGTLWISGKGGVLRERITMEALAGKLARMTGGPVQDETGLSGKYDLRMHWGRDHSLEDFTAADPRSRASDGLAAAVQSQLGLNLERKTITIEMLVVDHAEKIPTPN